MKRRPALAALAAALVLASAGCSSGGSGAAATTSPTPSGVQAELAAAKRFAQCARTHGYPTFPDPVINSDRIQFVNASPNLKAQMQTLERVPECRRLLAAMQAFHHSRPRPTGTPDAAVIQQLQHLAECVRQHGVPNWPDPKSDGTFPISGSGIGDPKRTPAVRTALIACEKYQTGAAANFGGFS